METKTIVRWEAKREDRETLRYALRTEPKGKGIEIGAYIVEADNAKAYLASLPIASLLEKQAESLGYEFGDDDWNDL